MKIVYPAFATALVIGSLSALFAIWTVNAFAADLVDQTKPFSGIYQLKGNCALPEVKQLNDLGKGKLILSIKHDDQAVAHRLHTEAGNTVSVGEKANAFLALTLFLEIPTSPTAKSEAPKESEDEDEEKKLRTLFPYSFPLAPRSATGYMDWFEIPERLRKIGPDEKKYLEDSSHFFQTTITDNPSALSVNSTNYEVLTVPHPKDPTQLAIENRITKVKLRLVKALKARVLSLEWRVESNLAKTAKYRCEFERLN